MRPTLIPLILGLFMASPALAQPPEPEEEEEALCADRPGLASSTCTVEPGRTQVELAVDWSFQEEGDSRTDTILAGDTVVRVGIDEQTELQAGWTAYGHVRERISGVVTRDDGVGDAFVGVRRGVYERNGFSAALQGRVSLPIGGNAIGAGDWGAELLVPLGLERGGVELLVTPAIAAAPDSDGDGRHLAYGLTAGIGFNLSERLSAVLDLSVARDDDPLDATTTVLAAIAFALEVSKNFQLDAGAVFGLNRDSPDLELYVGAASRF
jgi:hypothetical protein